MVALEDDGNEEFQEDQVDNEHIAHKEGESCYFRTAAWVCKAISNVVRVGGVWDALVLRLMRDDKGLSNEVPSVSCPYDKEGQESIRE